MTVAVIVLGICLFGALIVVAYLLWLSREERRDLTDRVMSLSSPISLASFKSSLGTPRESDVSYIDEAREYELNPPAAASIEAE